MRYVMSWVLLWSDCVVAEGVDSFFTAVYYDKSAAGNYSFTVGKCNPPPM